MSNPPPSQSFTQSGVNQIRNSDTLALRRYITARDDNPYDLSPTTVLLDLTHSNLKQRHIEIRFDRHDSVEQLKLKIHQKTGTPPHFQHLQFKVCGEILQELNSDAYDHYKLGFFIGGTNDNTSSASAVYSYEVHCVDTNPNSCSVGGQYEDVSLVEKYKMSDAEYDKRKGTIRDWSREQQAQDSTFSLAKHAREHREWVEARRQHKLGLPLPPGFVLDSTGEVIRDEPDVDDLNNNSNINSVSGNTVETTATTTEFDETSVSHAIIDARCQVDPGKRRGKVSYIGLVPELGSGQWIGVTFDEPVGKTDGSVSVPVNAKKGGPSSGGSDDPTTTKRYFEAMPRYASFVRGKNVEVGDFPERDLLEDSDDDEDEL
jgi:tubulin-specific chaperone B